MADGERSAEEGVEVGDEGGASRPAEWSPKPFLRGLWLGFAFGILAGVLVSVELGPDWWREGRGFIFFVIPLLVLNAVLLTFLRPSREEAARSTRYLRRRLGERRILETAGVAIMVVGLAAVLTCGLLEWPHYGLALGLLMAGFLVALPAASLRRAEAAREDRAPRHPADKLRG